MKRYVVSILAVLVLCALAAIPANAPDTRGLLCPACKIIIDYGAVSAAASGLQVSCSTIRCRAAAANLVIVAAKACDSEVRALDSAKLTQAQFDRMNKLWMDSCDRATLMNRWRVQMLHGVTVNEGDVETFMNAWADEMLRVPREVAEGKVPQ
jgi:hypothetical protein